MTSFSISSAYKAFSRARYIRKASGKEKVYSPAEIEFIEFLDRRLKSYIDNSQLVAAYGYLSILEEMDPTHSSVDSFSQSVNNDILKQARIKLIPSPFTDNNPAHQLGKTVANGIRQKLDEDAATSLIVIDGSSADYAPMNLAKKMNAGSFYFLSGEVLVAEVDTKVSSKTEARNVLVSTKKVQNPEYVAWTEMNKRKRKDIPEPMAILEQDVYDDVIIPTSIISKTAKVSVTYRVTEATSAAVKYSDAIEKTDSQVTENVEAVNRGLFSQAAKINAVPSDGDVLAETSLMISKAAAEKLMAEVEKLEDNYLALAAAAAELKEYNKATANLAYRNVLLQAKGKEDPQLLKSLRENAILWR